MRVERAEHKMSNTQKVIIKTLNGLWDGLSYTSRSGNKVHLELLDKKKKKKPDSRVFEGCGVRVVLQHLKSLMKFCPGNEAEKEKVSSNSFWISSCGNLTSRQFLQSTCDVRQSSGFCLPLLMGSSPHGCEVKQSMKRSGGRAGKMSGYLERVQLIVAQVGSLGGLPQLDHAGFPELCSHRFTGEGNT